MHILPGKSTKSKKIDGIFLKWQKTYAGVRLTNEKYFSATLAL
tara:strand:- start:95 stop:223 length:129 start_codon:yes stop_codon:yes gene_type:complete